MVQNAPIHPTLLGSSSCRATSTWPPAGSALRFSSPHLPTPLKRSTANLRRSKTNQLLNLSAVHGVTKFFDLTPAKFRRHYLGLKQRRLKLLPSLSLSLSMDPTSYPPPAAAAEPPAYLAPAANPTPLHAPINHPPYAEMITEAITALKEKDGSSRQAIAKYIEKAYSNLPATHSTLLTHQLKRLKNTGQLVMVKHSYMLPRSVPHPLLSPPPPPTDDDTGNVNENALSSGPKRGPGRPPKPKMLAQPSNSGVGRMLVSLGLVDGSAPMARRGPGRPPKSAKTELGNRARGRPPRPKSLSLLMGQGGLKRMPGRPPKTGPIGLGRPRGRPPKNVSAAAAVGGGDVVAVGGGVVPGKRRGRRPRADGLRKVNVGVLPGKRRGRRPIADGVKMPRQLTGKPLGRPRKNSSITGIQAAATQQSVPYEDLKNKVEHFQSRIKHTVNMVKPYVNSEAAFGALQELEELAAMDLNAPLNVPVQGQVQEPFLQNL